MSSGVPDYNKLYRLGKLPHGMRQFIPGLNEADKIEKELKEKMCKLCRKKIFGIEEPNEIKPE